MAKLHVEAGKSQGKTVEIDRQAVIGRGETAQLQINDLKASREHCKVFEQAGQWTVADLSSRNGIKVNGVQTTRKTLANGDRIEVGETVIVFEGGPAAKSASAPAPAAVKAGDASAKKAAAMAEARAAASAAKPAAPAAAKGGAKAAAPAKSGAAKSEGKGLEVSDRVLQFHKVDPKKAGVMDVDLTQTPGSTKILIWLGCLAFLGILVWMFSTLVQ